MADLNLKELAFGVLTVAVGFFNAYLWQDLIFAGELKNAAFYSWPVVTLLGFAVLFSLSSAFILKKWLRISSAVSGLSAGYILIPFQPLIVSAAAVTALIGWYASAQINREESTSNAFSAHKILRSGLPVFFTAVTLTLAVFYFTTVSGTSSAVLLPKAVFDAALPLLARPLQNILPGFGSDASVDELLLAFASVQIGQAQDINKLPPAEKKELLRQSRETLSQQFGIKLTGNENSSDVLYKLTNAQTAKFLGPYQKYLPIIAAAGFFIAVKTFTLPVYWLTLILVFLVVKLLLAAGVLKRETITVEVDKITF